MFGKKAAPTGPSDCERLQVHIAYLRSLAERLKSTDAEAVGAAAGMLEEFGDYMHKDGHRK